jgi:hypothetical protein
MFVAIFVLLVHWENGRMESRNSKVYIPIIQKADGINRKMLIKLGLL